MKGLKEAIDLPRTAKLFLSVYVMGRDKVRRGEEEEDRLTEQDTAEGERKAGRDKSKYKSKDR